MDLLDILSLMGLEWLSDAVERRYGRTASLLVTCGVALAIVAALVALLIALI
jgi:hypothetical protein